MLIAGLVESFIFCNCGEIVRSAAEKCSQALYLSSWYNLKRIDQRKIVLFMMKGSQMDVGFTASAFKVSLELYMLVSRKRRRICLKWFLLKIIFI